jgi:hypothetical protein
VAELPSERLRYWYRQQYKLAPTDERYLNTTDLQIELEWENFKLANPHLVKKEEAYRDPNYAEAEQELDNEASEVSPESAQPTIAEYEAAKEKAAAIRRAILEGMEHTEAPASPPSQENWEDVEIEGDDEP